MRGFEKMVLRYSEQFIVFLTMAEADELVAILVPLIRSFLLEA